MLSLIIGLSCELGLIKKTGTVAGKGLLMGGEKGSNVLVVSSLLLGLDFEFGLYVRFDSLYPGLDVLFGAGQEFFFGYVENSVLDMWRESVACRINSI